MADSCSTVPHLAHGKPYAETFRCPGGRLALDFCNTGQGARGSRATEWLAEFDDLVGWLQAAGSLGEAQAARLRKRAASSPRPAREVWQRALRLREALYRVLDARAHGRNAAREDLAVIEAEHARAAPLTSLAWRDGAYAWSLEAASDELGAVLQPIVASAIELLTSPDIERLTRCGNEATCHWLFLDESRNRSRRWCEMASCGNVAKVRRHRARQRRRR